MKVLYCRRCDLGFCEEHIGEHPEQEGHTLVEDERVGFCCICMNIYKPEEK